MTLETRTLSRPLEARTTARGRMIAGYAAVFNSAADIGGSFREIVAPGAFTNTLRDADVRAYFDHDRGRILGRTKAGTLRLSEDERGLAVEIDLPATTDGADLEVLLARGDIDGMSFGFRVRHDEWDETTTPPTRTIHEVQLREVSVVSEPAYGDTSIALRALEDGRAARKEVEIARRAEKRAHINRRLRARAQVDLRERGISAR